jgi:hypothetical protein
MSGEAAALCLFLSSFSKRLKAFNPKKWAGSVQVRVQVQFRFERIEKARECMEGKTGPKPHLIHSVLF